MAGAVRRGIEQLDPAAAVRDAAGAALAALTCPDPGHVRLLLCADDTADDIAPTIPGRELAARLLPEVPWHGDASWDRDPWRALLDTRPAQRVLGWRPRQRWRTAREG